MTWLAAFLWTNGLELPIYAWRLRGRVAPVGLLGLVVFLNGATHPALWFLLPAWGPAEGLLVGELLVVLAEGVLLWLASRTRLVSPPLEFHRSLAASLLANTFSASVGVLWWITG